MTKKNYRITKNKINDLWRVEEEDRYGDWKPVSQQVDSRAGAEQLLIALKHDDDLMTWVPVL